MLLNLCLCVFVVYVQFVCTKADTTRFAYVSEPDSNGNRHSYGVCICAKCGSSSAFNAIYSSLFKTPYVPPLGGPWVHDFKIWSSPKVYSWNRMYNTFGHNNFDEVYLITRNPLERYISAFYSKLSCCETQQTSLACVSNVVEGGKSRFRKDLLKSAHMPDNNKFCVDFEEYSNALLKISTLSISDQREVNSHFQQQQFVLEQCIGLNTKYIVGEPSILNDISQDKYKYPYPLQVKRDKNVNKKKHIGTIVLDKKYLQQICDASKAEYAFFAKNGIQMERCEETMKKYLKNTKESNIIMPTKNNDRRPLCFVHIPKNAGTSITRIIKNNNLPIRICEHPGGAKCVDKDRAVVVVRDPFEHFASAVNHAIKEYGHELQIKRIIDNGLTTPNDWAEALSNPPGNDLRNMVEGEINNRQHLIDGVKFKLKWTYSPQSLWLNGLENPIYLRFSNLQNDWSEMLDAYNLENIPLTVKLTQGDAGIVVANKKPVKEVYFSEKACKVLREMYKDDILNAHIPTSKYCHSKYTLKSNKDIKHSKWISTMMIRIERAADIVRGGYRKSSIKDDKSPVTNADIESSNILTSNWDMTPIISEETWSSHWYKKKLPNLVTWVDPLDATQEYTEGLTQYVTIMACLTENGRPKAGIIHFPFRNETWIASESELIVSQHKQIYAPEKVIVSRSHAGEVASIVHGYSIESAGGSGYKIVEVLSGRAKAYMHVTKIKTWDICAADAVMQAVNGTFVQWTDGKQFDYTTNLQTEGVFASIEMNLQWFKISTMMRSDLFQLSLVCIAWLCIFMYPQKKLVVREHYESKHVSFALCAIALLSCYLIWGVAQERIMSFKYGDESFEYPAVLVFVNRGFAALFATYFVKKASTPFKMFSVASITNIISSVCQYNALKSTIFPVVVVFKSLKLIPVLFVGKYFFRKKYKPHAYVLALVMAIGVSLTVISRHKGSQEQSFVGIGLMLVYVMADALTSQWQSYVFKKYETPPLEMMQGVNLCSALLTGIMVVTSGQINAAFHFGVRHPEFVLHACALSFPAILGQWFIFKTIEKHGAVAFSMVMTSRQAFALVTSCLIFGHKLNMNTIVGVTIVTLALFAKTRLQLSYPDNYVKIPQHDKEDLVELEKGQRKD